MECNALKLKFLEIDAPENTLFSHIFIQIQVGYTVQYIDILKSYLNLNKYGIWPKSVFYGASIFKYLGFDALHSSTSYYGIVNIRDFFK